jgi:environmental stress-induced protein Ves
MPLLTQTDFVKMPWKNGQGVTTELFRLGEVLRISKAQVEGNCSFSLFPDCYRILMQLSGNPMTLSHENGQKIELKRFQSYVFDGALKTDCQLVGKASDFNVFCKKGTLSAQLNCFKMERGQTFTVTHSQEVFLYLISGEVRFGESVIQSDEAFYQPKTQEPLPPVKALVPSQMILLIFS